jgi:hypothetical protein
MNAVPACLGLFAGTMFESLFGVHVFTWSGNDCVSHIAIPYQNVAASWKLYVRDAGFVAGGSRGMTPVYRIRFPDPGTFE